MSYKSVVLFGGLAGGMVIALSGTLIAGQVTLPNSFTAGTPAIASEVNANFNAVATAVNDNAARLTTIESTVSGGNIVLAPSTATTGNILKGTDPFIQSFGTDNIFIGVGAGNFTTTGMSNTATGPRALAFNTTGSLNTAIGDDALRGNTTGAGNTAIGEGTLLNNAGGDNNTAVGRDALQNSSGSSNIAIGDSAGFGLTTGGNNIYIGALAMSGAETNNIRIGTSQTRAFIAGIRGVTTANANAVPVVVDSAGQLGTVSSSRRVKDTINAMDTASSVLMQLRPVTFYYKSDRNPEGRTLQYGLVAEDVAKVAPGLVSHSADGGIETVYYQFLPPMLLNEYQKQQRTIEAQAAQIAAQRAQLKEQSARIDALENQGARTAAALSRLERSGTITTAAR